MTRSLQREGSLAILASAMLGACAAAPATTDTGQVWVEVAALDAGAVLQQDGAAMILKAVELDGRGQALSWNLPAGADNAAWALRHCLDYGPVFRPFGRRTPPPWQEPGLVRSEALRCAALARLPAAVESALPAQDKFDVWLGQQGPDPAAQPGSPLWSNSGSMLGGMWLVWKPGLSDLAAVTAGARRCRDAAEQAGGIDSYESPPPGNRTDVMYLQSYSISAARLLQNFAQCMGQQGYELLPPHSEPDAADWQPPEPGENPMAAGRLMWQNDPPGKAVTTPLPAGR